MKTLASLLLALALLAAAPHVVPEAHATRCSNGSCE